MALMRIPEGLEMPPPPPAPLSDRELRELMTNAANGALAVFQEIGKLTAIAARAEMAAQSAAMSAKSCQDAASRIEASVRKLTPSIPPPPPLFSEEPLAKARRKLDSLAEIRDEDTTAVRDLREQIAEIAKRDAAEMAVAEADRRRMKNLAWGLGIIMSVAAVAAIVWGVFKFAVANAH